MERIRVIDSHTGGEPTRVVIEGAPAELVTGTSLSARRSLFRDRYDWFRSAVVDEPRGSDVLVGALLVEPAEPECAAGVLFFNNAGMLGMCGHGVIGLVATLAHLGRIGPGTHRIDTPVGAVEAALCESGDVTIRNVAAYLYREGVTVRVDGRGTVTGDVAWGGNWFFLVEDHGFELSLANTRSLTDFCLRVRKSLELEGVTGEGGAEIDHVELCGEPWSSLADSRNFVLCPGGAYDRSPCGTGTSARVAALAARGRLAEGEVWRQESITGSLFEATYERDSEGVIFPRITGRAYITADATLLLDPNDPIRYGIAPE